MTGELRARAGSIALAVVVGALVLTAAASVLLPFALVFYPFVVFGPIAAAAGDASGSGRDRPRRARRVAAPSAAWRWS